MNLPNKLTLSRIFMIPFFVAFLLMENVTSNAAVIAVCRCAAFVIFVVATLTDYWDGYLARKHNLITSFGKLFDPLADKLLTMAAFVAFVEMRIFPAWAIIVILAREFLVTGLRSLATSQGRVIQADRWGKHKTGWQLGSTIGILFVLSARDLTRAAGFGTRLFDIWLPYAYYAVLLVVVSLTVVSGILYLSNNWDLITDREG